MYNISILVKILSIALSEEKTLFSETFIHVFNYNTLSTVFKLHNEDIYFKNMVSSSEVGFI